MLSSKKVAASSLSSLDLFLQHKDALRCYVNASGEWFTFLASTAETENFDTSLNNAVFRNLEDACSYVCNNYSLDHMSIDDFINRSVRITRVNDVWYRSDNGGGDDFDMAGIGHDFTISEYMELLG